MTSAKVNNYQYEENESHFKKKIIYLWPRARLIPITLMGLLLVMKHCEMIS